MKYNIILYIGILFCISCSNSKEWKIIDTIELGSTTPIGLTFQGDKICLSDGDHNQLVVINANGEEQEKLTGLERPMHIDSENGVLYVPEYGSDQITKIENGKRSILSLPDSLDAPASIDVFNKEIAIADFYNHRILYFDGAEWIKFGKEGKEKGELYYPTDVHISQEQIFVADAYNNRVQVFDKKGNSVQIIGKEEKMNAATGIYVSGDQVFVTDFENDRVLVYAHSGNLEQIIEEGINKPTDVLIIGDILYIANYKGKNVLKLKM